MSVYYFGCIGEPGHYLHDKQLQGIADRRLPSDFPCPVATLDGGLFPPRHPRDDGRAVLAHLSGWTILTFWDRSIDSRPGSLSAFVMAGIFDFRDAARLARESFPTIWKRYRFAVTYDEPRYAEPAA